MLTLYQTEWCPSCHRVRQVLTELGLTFTSVSVAAEEDERTDVLEVSGQAVVPVLRDGDRVVNGGPAIIDYLRETYEPAADAAAHAAYAAFRKSRVVPLPPSDAVARLEEVLAEDGFSVIAKMGGSAISPTVATDLWVVYAAVPAAAAMALKLDAAAPSAAAVPFSVAAVEGGSRVTAVNPVALVWLFGEPALTKVQRALRDRVYKVVDRL